MANYDTLKATIDAYIRANYQKAITGPVLNGVLTAMVDSLGAGYLFMGEAVPSTDPGTPDQPVFYIAWTRGVYSNFDGRIMGLDDIGLYLWSDGAWTYKALPVAKDSALAMKQDLLRSGINIKTINSESLLGSGNIEIQGGGGSAYVIEGTYDTTTPAATVTTGDFAGAKAAFDAGTQVYAKMEDTTEPGAYLVFTPAIVASALMVLMFSTGQEVFVLALASGESPFAQKIRMQEYGLVTDFSDPDNATYPSTKAVDDALGDKINLVQGGTTGNFASLDSAGGVADSGKKASDFATSAQGGKADTAVQPGDLATVATSGSYNDLTDLPLIPQAQIQSDWDQADNTKKDYIKNKPTIPTVPTISTDIVSDRNSNDKTTSPKATFDGIGKYGVISQTQTWANDYGSYTISDKVYGLIPQAFIDRWLALVYEWGTFNESTGYFELNGLTDISYREAINIVNRYNPGQGTDGWRPNSNNQSDYFKARTTIPCIAAPSAHPYLTWNIWIECTHFAYNQTANFTSLTQYGCRRLRRMLDKIQATAAITLSLWNALEECYIATNNTISAPNSKFLSLASIVYMVDNATNTGAVTYTFHADAYARCVADTTEYTYNGQTYTGIIAYAAARNITIASA